MSKHYLLDIHQTDPTHGTIKGVEIPVSGHTYIDGTYVVSVPDDVDIPSSVTYAGALLTAKYAGMLANSGIFTHIVYDDMLDPNGINMAASACITTGMRNVCGLYPASFWATPGYPTPTMQMNMVTLATTPSEAMVYWEAFSYDEWDITTKAYHRRYGIELETVFSCEVSFNNGASWIPTTHGTLLNIPPVDQGNQMIIRFTAGWGQTRYYLGSWAVLY